MAGNFQKTTSNFFITFLIGLIVVSFMFTGLESMKGSPGAVAKVGSHPISGREYQMEYNRQLNFYKNAIFGGKDLTSQQIEQFGIKNAAMKNLVQGKLQLIFAENAGITAAPQQVKKTIKKFEFFNTNGQFDLNKYKGLLAANDLSPQDFEEDMTRQVLTENSQSLFSQFPVSEGYLDDLRDFKAMRYNASIVEVTDANLQKNLTISKSEVSEYLKNEANNARVESTFKTRKPSLDVPEKVKASHILIKTVKGQDDSKQRAKIEKIAKEVTARNFKSKANKYTEDPSGKGKGGSLGIFGRKRMVPEFDKVAFSLKPGSISKPIKTDFGYHLIYVEKKIAGKEAKLSDHKNSIATEFIRNGKKDEVKKLAVEVKAMIVEAFKTGDMKKIKTLKAKYGFAMDENTPFNRVDGSLGKITLNSSENKTIFAGLKDKEADIFTFDLDSKIQVVAIEKSSNKDLPAFDRKKEKNGLQMVLSNKIKKNVLKAIGDNTAVKTFAKL
jgi:peptidyl-prolyl cis-trans isomerase D